MTHIAWTKIESFYHVRKTVTTYSHLLEGRPVVSYRAKVKLHGTCGGIRIDSDGTVTAMSRTTVLSENCDNAGFGRWVKENETAWQNISPERGHVVVFGEWCGPGIQKGVAVSQVKERVFAVFAMRKIVDEQCEEFIVDPSHLSTEIEALPNVFILPWYARNQEVVEYDIDWSLPGEELQISIERINEHVQEVEACDPWVKSLFKKEGTGEGLVFYPVSHLGYQNFSNLCFKAKGEKHKGVARTKSVQVDPTIAASASQFAEMVVTPARLEQGVRAVNDGELKFDLRKMGPFLGWICADVEKETAVEMAAAGLDLKVALRACNDRARSWYLSESKKL